MIISSQEMDYNLDFYLLCTSKISVFGGSAWEYNAERGECYLHQFYKEQPDLNLRTPEVVAKLTDIMNFWLDLGVDGFHIDSVAHFFEGKIIVLMKCPGWNDYKFTHSHTHAVFCLISDEQFRNERGSGNNYADLEHKHTYNQPKVLELLATFREVLDKNTEEDSYNPR